MNSNSKAGNGALISAQQIACFAYCPEQWRLQYGLGLEPGNGELLASGNRHHARKAVAERVASMALTLGRWLIVLAVLGLFLLWLRTR